jgi:hypothetical protein
MRWKVLQGYLPLRSCLAAVVRTIEAKYLDTGGDEREPASPRVGQSKVASNQGATVRKTEAHLTHDTTAVSK